MSRILYQYRALHYCLVFFSWALFCTGCGRGEKNIDEYTNWMHDPDHGLVQIRYVNGLRMSAQYQPPEYCSYQERPEEGRQRSGSGGEASEAGRNRGMTFVLSIGPDERLHSGSDIMTRGVSSYGDFAERARMMNFDIKEYFHLKIGNHEIAPALATLENTYGLSPGRNIVVVFERPDDFEKSEQLDLIFEDRIFDTGINHFVFHTESLTHTPKLAL